MKRYIALLRGINVGQNHRVPMKQLKEIFEMLDCTNVSTYINSGNVVFEMSHGATLSREKIEKTFKKEFGFEIPTLIKSETEMKTIVRAIPVEWKNDATTQRTDVAYLFPEADSKKILASLPFNTEIIDVRYVKGALIWNLNRKNYTRSKLNKLIGHALYQQMTMRNVNTARYLANLE